MALRSARGQEGSASPPPHTWRGFLAQGRSRVGGRRLREDISEDAFSKKKSDTDLPRPAPLWALASLLLTCHLLRRREKKSPPPGGHAACAFQTSSQRVAQTPWPASPMADQIVITKALLILSPWYRVQERDEIYFDWFVKNNLT